MKMRALLSHHKCLIGLEEKPDLWSEDQKKRKGEINEEAFNLIILSLSDSIIRKVSDCKTPTELWKKLEELFANQMAPNLAYLRATLYAFKMDASKSIDENLDEFLKIIILLNNPKETIDETSKGRFQSGQANRKTNSFNTNKPKTERKENGKGQQQKETRKCFFCGKTGQLRKDCTKFIARNQNNNASETNIATAVNQKCDMPEAHTIYDRSIENQWIFDSGCSFHMCPVISWFVDLTDAPAENVLMGNNNVCKVIGIGTVKLKLENGKEILLTQVRCVPGLKRNLISLGTLDDNGCEYNACNDVLTVSKNGRPILTASKHNSLYILNGTHVIPELNVANKEM
ncbi:unnamed protein product [Rhodiola kirilowii]